MSTRPNETSDPLKVEEVAAELQVSPQTVRNWIKGGELPASRAGHAWRVRRQDLDEMISRQQGESMTLGIHRNPWDPQTLGSPFRRRGRPTARARSVWDSSQQALELKKRS